MRTQITLMVALFVGLIVPACGSDDSSGDAGGSRGTDGAAAVDAAVDVPVGIDASAVDVPVSDGARDGASSTDVGVSDTGAQSDRTADLNPTMDTMPTLVSLSPEQLRNALASKDFVLIDVRTVCPARIAGLDACLSTNTNEVVAVIGPELDRRVVLVCQSGMRSTAVGNALIKLGYRNISQLQGGMNAWMAAGYPTSSDGGV